MFGLFGKNRKQIKEEIRRGISSIDEADREADRQAMWAKAMEEERRRVAEEAREMKPGERRKRILDKASDVGIHFVVYDRKLDDSLGRGHIEAAIEAGEVSVGEILRAISDSVREQLSGIPTPASKLRRG